jgi:branched-chain amino acid transport system substrate-binding protein
MGKKLYLFLGMIVISLFLTNYVSAKDKIRIGFSMSLTGIYAPAAEGEMQAYQLWLEDVNRKGGIFVKEFNKRIPVEFVYYDDASSTETAVRVYEKLITSDKVDLLLGPYGTTNHFAIVATIEKHKAPVIGSTASSIKIRDLGAKYIWFPTSCIPDRQMEALVGLLSSLKKEIKNISIIYLQELYPRENLQFLEPKLKEANFDIILKKDYPMGVKDLTTLLAEAKGKNPDAAIFLCYAADSFIITTQAKEVGLNPKFLFELVGPAAVAFGPKFSHNTEGITTMGHWSPKGKWPGAKDFFDRYVAKWKKKPDYLNSTLGYMAGQILEQAVEKSGTLNWEKIREIISTQEFMTINGPVSFTGNENRRTPSMILQWQKGELEIVWPPETATAKVLFPKPIWK